MSTSVGPRPYGRDQQENTSSIEQVSVPMSEVSPHHESFGESAKDLLAKSLLLSDPPRLELSYMSSRHSSTIRTLALESAEVDSGSFPVLRPRLTLVLRFLVLYLGIYVVALSRSSIATLAPVLIDAFHEPKDLGLYSSVETLTGSSTLLFFGQLNQIFEPKWLYLSSLTLFALSNVICGAACSSAVFILGRALSGLAFAGVSATAIVLVLQQFSRDASPLVLGLVTTGFSFGTISGPVLSGVIVSSLTWRWFYYVNSFIPFAIAIFCYPVLTNARRRRPSIRDLSVWDFDPFGNITFVSGVACLLLVLSWGGTYHSWKSVVIIVLLILAGLLFFVFIILEVEYNNTAMFPIRIIRNRNLCLCFGYSVLGGGIVTAGSYYLPLWFQVVNGDSARRSGVNMLPTVISAAVSAATIGALGQRLGFYSAYMVLSAAMTATAAGLFTTIKVQWPLKHRIGYQVLFGLGNGMGPQQPMLISQAILSKKDAPLGSSLMIFAQNLGAAIFVCVSQAVYSNTLQGKVSSTPNVPSSLVNGIDGNSSARGSSNQISLILHAYNTSIARVFYIPLSLAIAAIITGLCMTQKNWKTA